MNNAVVSAVGAALLFSVSGLQAKEVSIKDCDALLTTSTAPIDIDEVIDLETFLKEGTEKARIPPSNRNKSHIIIVPRDSSKVELEESERKSRIEEDLVTLRRIVTVLTAVPGQLKMAIAGKENRRCVEYTQNFQRAVVTVKVYDANGKILGNHTLIAGPAENLYISADLPVTNIKQLSYDVNTNSVIEKEKPASFYIGFNYKFGDVFTNYPVEKFYRDISLKFLVKASGKPSESMGLGLSYSFKKADIFVARVWTKDESSVGGENLGTTQATVFGISLNLTKGLNWLKGDK